MLLFKNILCTYVWVYNVVRWKGRYLVPKVGSDCAYEFNVLLFERYSGLLTEIMT